MKGFLFLLILSLNFIYSTKKILPSILKKILFKDLNRDPKDLYLREWLKKLSIDLPNDLIKEKTKGFIENITIYNISLESLISTHKQWIGKKIGLNITLRKASFNIKGKYKIISSEPKNFLAKVSSLNVTLPFFLVKNESGLITEVDTTGFTFYIEQAKIELDLEDINPVISKNLVDALKLILGIIKKDLIENNLIKLLNEKLAEMFETVNDIILNGVDPEELHILTNKADLADVRKSPILGSIAYLLSNLTGANGPLSLNNIINIFTFDTGIIHLKKLYDKEISFKFNLTDNNNNSLGNFELYLDDLNVSGLNTWRDFNALEPYDALQLLTYTNLDNLTINVSFSLRLKLDNTSKFVKNESILYERAQFRTNLQNNKLHASLQFPFNNKRASEYTNQECLNMNCIIDLIDSNGTGITALSLNETFTYILLEVREGGDLEEDLDELIDKITDLFIAGFDEQIALLINALLNSTIINLANEKINEYLYPINCPGEEDPDDSEIDIGMTTMASCSALGLFTLFIFCPYILGKACKKNKGEKLVEEEENNERISNVSDLKDVKNAPIEAKYCIEGISIQWIKEFGRIDPYGASLFLDPRIPIFFRLFIPLAILLTIASFISSNSGTGASVFVVFHVGRRIQVPSLFDFGLINSVHDMWEAGSWILSLLVAIFSGFWPYLKLILMLITFFLPASILSYKRREKILIILDATGKFSILDSYVMIMMLVAFHFHVDIPITDQSKAENGAIVDVFVYAAYGFVTLIVGTLISLFLSHIITHLHRSLEEHPDQNKGEKAENYKSIMSFAKIKCIGNLPFRIFISFLLFLTLGLVIAGSVTQCFSFYFHGLAGYALDLLKIPPHREFSIINLGTSVRKAYESPNDPTIIFTQTIYFLTVLAIPLSFLAVVIILWFIPMPRKAQKIFYDIAEILNAWSCIDVFVIAILASLTEISQFTEFIVGDKCDFINPIIQKYFSKTLDGHDTCFEVRTYLEEGCWLFFGAAISFFICSFVILKACRNALNERLPDHVKEYLKMKKNEDNNNRISRISNINDFSSSRTSLANETNI